METLIKGVIITDPQSPHHGTVRDVLIQEGKIVRIDPHIDAEPSMRIWDEPGSALSVGWMDLQADFADPGQEQKEGLESGSRAAQVGGFTHVVLNTGQAPSPDHKSAIAYLRARAAALDTVLLPMGSLSQRHEGNQLAELLDLANAGAVAFSDDGPVNRTELLRRALEYTEALAQPVITCPLDFGLNAHPQMHEGITSTLMGVVGNPHISETMRIKRDLDILRYSGGKLHFSCISTAESVALVREAKAEGLHVTCATSAHHLFFIDEDLERFDGTLKVIPPFRLNADREALCAGVLDGTIDAIISDHRPEDLEHHDVEFALSPFGMSAIESVFPVAISAIGSSGQDAIIRALTLGPRNALGMEMPRIEVGQEADLTWFHPSKPWVHQKASKAVNHTDYVNRRTSFSGLGTPLGVITPRPAGR